MGKGHRVPIRPPGMWKDTVAFGKKLRAVRVGRGLTKVAAAKQLGIDVRVLGRLEGGKGRPARWQQERIYRWATKGETFEGLCKKQPQQVEVEVWPVTKVRLEPATHRQMAVTAERIGLSQSEFIALAVDRLLREPGELATYEMAMERLERVKVAAALQENKGMTQFLRAELQLCIDMGARLTKAAEEAPPIDLTKWQLP